MDAIEELEGIKGKGNFRVILERNYITITMESIITIKKQANNKIKSTLT